MEDRKESKESRLRTDNSTTTRGKIRQHTQRDRNESLNNQRNYTHVTHEDQLLAKVAGVRRMADEMSRADPCRENISGSIKSRSKSTRRGGDISLNTKTR